MIFTRTTFLSSCLFLSLFLGAQKKTANMELIYHEPYCGGARPTDEILAEAQKPKPYAGRKLILVSKTGKVDTVTTDLNGKLKLKLKKGEYHLFEAWRFYKLTYNGAPVEQFDKTCLIKEWEKATVEISVTRKKTKITFKNELQNYCDWSTPCLLETHMPPLRE